MHKLSRSGIEPVLGQHNHAFCSQQPVTFQMLQVLSKILFVLMTSFLTLKKLMIVPVAFHILNKLLFFPLIYGILEATSHVAMDPSISRGITLPPVDVTSSQFAPFVHRTAGFEPWTQHRLCKDGNTTHFNVASQSVILKNSLNHKQHYGDNAM